MYFSEVNWEEDDVRLNFAPALVFAVGAVFCVLVAVWVTWLATAQPWLGLKLDTRDDRVIITDITADSGLPDTFVGAELKGIASAGRADQAIAPIDLIEEPDGLGVAERLKAFYARQDRLFDHLSQGAVTLVLSDATGQRRVDTTVAPRRPISDLPLKFWVQVGVGLFGLIIGLWVVTLRPRDLAAQMVLLSGAALALSACAAALYSSRELALSQEFFSTASRANTSGTLIFGIGMVTLFLIYPRRIVPQALVMVPALVIGGLLLGVLTINWPDNLVHTPMLVAIIMLCLLLAILAQVIVNRRNATARAMLGWLGLSVGIGAGGFVLTAIVPLLFGQDLLLEQSTAFLFFLLLYAGIALGVARYRLFDLSVWSFEILFYGMGVALLLVLDALLILVVSVDRAPAFGIALAAVAMVYLPLRGQIWSGLRRNREMPPDTLFTRITEIAHAPDPTTKTALLHGLWDDLFTPLSIEDLPPLPLSDTELVDTGAALHIAPVHGLPALRLNWRGRGSKLFSSRDLARAKSINALIDTSLRQNQTYLEAVTNERNRINRDMHDNLGILLVSALHTPASKRKDTLIRQTLTDLREIIANEGQTNQPLPRLIADLRSELSDHLEAAGIGFTWHYDALPDMSVRANAVHVARAFFRETVQNIIRHAQARHVTVQIEVTEGDVLSVRLKDNGKGFDPTQDRTGSGVRNLSSRLAQAGGSYDCQSSKDGTEVSMHLPLTTPSQRAAE